MLQHMRSNLKVFLFFLVLLSCKKGDNEQFIITRQIGISEVLIAYKQLEMKEKPFHLSKTILKLNRGDIFNAVSEITVKYSLEKNKLLEEITDGYKEIQFKEKKGYIRYYTVEYLMQDKSIAVCLDEKNECREGIEHSLNFHDFKISAAYDYTDDNGTYVRIRTDESATADDQPNPIVFIIRNGSSPDKVVEPFGETLQFKTQDFKKTGEHRFQFKTAERLLELELEKESPQKYRIHILKYEGPESETFKEKVNGFKVEYGY